MLYNIKTLPLHCVFHGIRFKVNEDWVSAIDTLLFFIPLALVAWLFSDIILKTHHITSLGSFRHLVEERKENRLYFR